MVLLNQVVPQNSGPQGINFRARKAANEEEWHAARASLACEVPIKPAALLDADTFYDAGDKACGEGPRRNRHTDARAITFDLPDFAGDLKRVPDTNLRSKRKHCGAQRAPQCFLFERKLV